MLNIFLIALGGSIGSVARFLVSSSISKIFTPGTIPYGTMFVNLFGCLITGIIMAFFANKTEALPGKYFLITGMMGGFTTFSAFSYETITLLKEADFFRAFTYIFLSLFGCLFLCFCGFRFGENFLLK